MKTYIALSALVAITSIPPAHAQMLIVDVTNPDRVTFTAGPDFPIAADSITDSAAGISLIGFFTAYLNAEDVIHRFASSTTLQGVGFGDRFINSAAVDNFQAGIPSQGQDLNLAVIPYPSPSWDFRTDQIGLLGTASFDLSASEDLPLPGHSGTIMTGFSQNNGIQVGYYTVIPEPATFTLFIGIAALCTAGYQRRK